MNILLDRLPDTVSIDEVDYPINTDFRIGIQFEMLLKSQKLKDIEKIIQALQLYYPKVPGNITKAVDQLLWFYNCNLTIDQKQTKSSSSSQEVFSYEQDQYMIYTAFLSFYHIDLNSIEYLHWWKFKQLFNELPDEAKIKKVMMYRMIKLSSAMSKEQRQFYADMKNIYQLHNKTDEQKARSFGSILAGGMYLPKEDQNSSIEK